MISTIKDKQKVKCIMSILILSLENRTWWVVLIFPTINSFLSFHWRWKYLMKHRPKYSAELLKKNLLRNLTQHLLFLSLNMWLEMFQPYYQVLVRFFFVNLPQPRVIWEEEFQLRKGLHCWQMFLSCLVLQLTSLKETHRDLH